MASEAWQALVARLSETYGCSLRLTKLWLFLFLILIFFFYIICLFLKVHGILAVVHSLVSEPNSDIVLLAPVLAGVCFYC